MTRKITTWCPLLLLAAVAAGAVAEVRVQDIARLQGQRTNKLMGYGLVVGLSGTGDGEKYGPTIRALMQLHQRFHQPIQGDADVKGNRSVALVTVEATIPEFGAREGQAIDVIVSAVGTAKSLRNGQLLTTPLQYAMFDPDDPSTQHILALAGGRIELTDELSPTRGVIRQGATLEEDFLYTFIEDDRITLVLDDAHAGWTWSQIVARALNHELASPALGTPAGNAAGRPPIGGDPATALGPKTIQVRVPPFELQNPANYIARVLQAPLFMLPPQAARVTINRATKNVSFAGNVTISPTVIQIPSLGTVMIGKTEGGEGDKPADNGKSPDASKSGKSGNVAPIEFRELLDTLANIKATPDQLINAIEHLHKTGSLHAQLQYE